jgi:hypothetical protein
MQKFTLRSNDENRKNTSVVFPFAGVTSFNESGIAEVELKDEEELQHILKSIEDLYVPKEGSEEGSEINPQVQDNELGKSEDEKNDIGGDSSDGSEFTGQSQSHDAGAGSSGDLASQLEALKLPELKQLASDSGFPEEEWKALKKEELKAYLSSKLQPQA